MSYLRFLRSGSEATEPSWEMHPSENDGLFGLQRSSSGAERSDQGAVERPIAIVEHQAHDRT